MAMTDDDLAVIRDHIGDEPDDETVEETFDRFGTAGKTIVAILDKRLANMLSEPASLSIPGVISISNAENMRVQREQLLRAASGVAVTTVQTLRSDQRRRSWRRIGQF